MSEVVVYSTEPCRFCAGVKGLLQARGIEFREVNLAKDPQGRIELAGRTGMMTFPQVVIDGRLLGGFSELQAAAQDGRLDPLLIGGPPSGPAPGAAPPLEEPAPALEEPAA
jgi:glutaredoxin 3